MARYYTYTGFPFKDGNGNHTFADGRREWTEQVEALRRTILKPDPMNPTKKIVERPSLIKVVSHPTIIGAGWIKSFAAEPLTDPRFIEVDEDGPDGDIVHQLYGEDIGPEKRGVIHELAMLKPQLEPAKALKAETESELATIDGELEAIDAAEVPALAKIINDHRAEVDGKRKAAVKVLDANAAAIAKRNELLAQWEAMGMQVEAPKDDPETPEDEAADFEKKTFMDKVMAWFGVK